MQPSLRFRLKHPDPNQRQDAVLSLIFAPELQYLNDLLECLQDKDRDVRRSVVQALGALHHADAIPALMQGLLDAAEDVALAAEDALSKFPQALPALLDWLSAPEWPQRIAALRGLRHFSLPAHLVHLLPLVQDPVWEVRYQVYLLLGQSQQPDAFESLKLALFREVHPQAHEGIIHGLSLLQMPAASDLLGQIFLATNDEEQAQTLAMALENDGDHCTQLLKTEGLGSPTHFIRSLSALLLAHRTLPVGPLIQPLLMDPQLQVREAAAYALYQIEPHQPFWEALVALYQASEAQFAGALKHLKSFPHPQANTLLLDLIDLLDSSETGNQQRSALITALGESRQQSLVSALLERLLSPERSDPETVALCKALGILDAWCAALPLQGLISHRQPQIQLAAAQALQQIQPEHSCWSQFTQRERLSSAGKQLLYQDLALFPGCALFLQRQALQETEPDNRAAALRALSHGPQSKLAFVHRYLKAYPQAEAETIDPILGLLAQEVPHPEIVRALLPWLETRDQALREATILVLRRLAEPYPELILPLLTHDVWFVRQAALLVLGPREEPDLLRALTQSTQDRDRDVCITSVALLAQTQAPERVELLVELLENGFRDIRAAAAQALGQQADLWALAPLQMALVEDEAEEVRAACASSLGHLGGAGACEALYEALQEEDHAEVWSACLVALHTQDPQQAQVWALRALNETPDFVTPAVLGLLRQSLGALQGLEALIEERLNDAQQASDIPLASAAYRLLIELEPERALEGIESSQPLYRQLALQEIQIPQAESVQLSLILLLNDPDPSLRQQVFQILKRSQTLWPVFVQHAVQEQDPAVQQSVIEGLCDLPSELALPSFHQIFEHSSEPIQRSLIWAVACFLDDGGAQLLLNWLPTCSRPLREQALQVLCRQTAAALPALKALSESWDTELLLLATRSLGQIGAVAVPLLQEIWLRDNLAVQVAVLEALKSLRLPSVLPLLKEAAQSSQDNLRAHAFEVLAVLNETAHPLLLELAQSNQQAQRYDACLTLAQLEPEHPWWQHLQGINSLRVAERRRHAIALHAVFSPELLPFVQHLRHDPATQVRAAYYDLPDRLENPDVAFLLEAERAAAHEVLPVRQAAMLSLNRLAPQRAQVLALRQWPQSQRLWRETLLAVLAETGLPGLAAQALDDPDSGVRLTATAVLGYYRLQNTLPQLLQRLPLENDIEIRCCLCWSLGQLARPEALPALQAALADTDYPVRLQATRALAEIPGTAQLLFELAQEIEQDTLWLTEALKGLQQQPYPPAGDYLLGRFYNAEDPELGQVLLDTLLALKDSEMNERLRGISRQSDHPLSLLCHQTLQEKLPLEVN